jgi:hypothetical protein
MGRSSATIVLTAVAGQIRANRLRQNVSLDIEDEVLQVSTNPESTKKNATPV